MKVSLICPIYNESDNIETLIKSMLKQTKKPSEIIFVDSFSTDGTDKIIRKYSHKNKFIKLIRKKTNISEARNHAIEKSENGLIACTDASSKLDKNWLKEIILPFKDESIDVVSGGYRAVSKGGIEDYISMIVVKPMDEWNEKDFLPSGRSVAFKKSAWKAVGGYPENLYTGEDTLFGLKLKERGFKFELAKKSVVYWRGRNTLGKFIKQFYLYGKGDGESKNIVKLKKNLAFFIGFNFWIFSIFFLLVVEWKFALILLFLPFIYLAYLGIKSSFQKKKGGCIFWIPLLILLKRIGYFFGVWRGLFK